jgi:hypothetical protein
VSDETASAASTILIVRLACALVLLAAISPLAAETAKLECTADAWVVPASKGSARLNGLGRDLTLNGYKRVLLLNFRTTHIVGWKLQDASLMLHLRSGKPPFRLDAGIQSESWSEGAASLRFAPPRQLLSFITAALPEGWFEVKLAPQFVESLAAGRGCGLVVAEHGASAERVFDSRETVQFAPYLVVDGIQIGMR